MKRRRLLQLGLGGAAALVLVGGGLSLAQPGLVDGRLSPRSREVFAALARALLDGALPAAPSARQAAITAHLGRVDATIAGLPAHVQKELSMLLAVLGSAPGRLGLAALHDDWPQASVAAIQAALQGMRFSSIAMRQQAYLALHELTNGAYFSDPSTWPLLGYPGPTAV
jgi:hypothetical protein